MRARNAPCSKIRITCLWGATMMLWSCAVRMNYSSCGSRHTGRISVSICWRHGIFCLEMRKQITGVAELIVGAARAADPRFAESDQPVLIDEYHHVPELELLDAIKAQLNRDLRPGRYILAGSTRYATMPEAAQARTGREDIIPVLPVSQGEIDDVRETFVASPPPPNSPGSSSSTSTRTSTSSPTSPGSPSNASTPDTHTGPVMGPA